MAELKPCPFCGGDVEETGGSCNFGKKIMTLNVKCRKWRASNGRTKYRDVMEKIIEMFGVPEGEL